MDLSGLASVTTAAEMDTWLLANFVTPVRPVVSGSDMGIILKKLIDVAGGTGVAIDDTTPSTSSVYSSTKIEALNALKADLVSGKVPSSQLPSYVDDVLEYANLAALPGTGETGKIYVTLDTNFEYRWSGSTYIQLVASPGTTDALAEGTTNLYFTVARVLATVLTGISFGTISAVVATDTLLVGLGKLQAQITDIYSKLIPSGGTTGQVLSKVNNTSYNTQWIDPPTSGFTNPMSALGDILYEDATPQATRLAGNITTTKKFLTQTGTGSASAAPAWSDLFGTANTWSAAQTIPDQSANDNSGKGANTKYVDAAVAVEAAARVAQATKFNANFFQSIL